MVRHLWQTDNLYAVALFLHYAELAVSWIQSAYRVTGKPSYNLYLVTPPRQPAGEVMNLLNRFGIVIL